MSKLGSVSSTDYGTESLNVFTILKSLYNIAIYYKTSVSVAG